MQSDENMMKVKKIGCNNVVINMIIGTGDRDSLRVFIESLSYMHNMVKTWENHGVDFQKENEVACKWKKKKFVKILKYELLTFWQTIIIIEFVADKK